MEIQQLKTLPEYQKLQEESEKFELLETLADNVSFKVTDSEEHRKSLQYIAPKNKKRKLRAANTGYFAPVEVLLDETPYDDEKLKPQSESIADSNESTYQPQKETGAIPRYYDPN